MKGLDWQEAQLPLPPDESIPKLRSLRANSAFSALSHAYDTVPEGRGMEESSNRPWKRFKFGKHRYERRPTEPQF